MNVKIDRLKEFLNNRATTLKNSMIQAESMGDIERYGAIELELFETTESLKKLQGL